MSGPTPPATFNSSPAPIDQDWVDAELVPFLQRVYPEERKTTMDWNRAIVFGRQCLDRLDQYEDFPFTIERLRLCLLNSELLTPAEMSKFIPITERGSQHCLRIFARHAIVHGPYMLYSLGEDPSQEFPRPQQTGTGQAPSPSAAPALPRAASVALLEARNVTLERELASLSMRVDQAERGHENGRGNGRGKGSGVHRGRLSQPGGGSDRGGRFNQGPGVPPMVQQTPSGLAPNAPQGYYPYPNPQYAYGSPYMAATAMGSYPMQPYQQQPLINPGQQHGGGWTGSQMMYSTHQDYSSQTGTSSGFAMPPQQVSNPYHQGQPTQRGRGSSRGQRGQAPSPQGLSAPPQQPPSGSGASTHVPRPDAEEFHPASGNGYN
ncbi:hypothetical protein BKA58DRAFT_465121 [Alternaria rosae]|uniref:uncharacterized protein n=1 Tax=Alternaria rosae TaxID=1187941 RepID=UPI001E8CB223|nr:uncharacterized protein BKA58DRAFT_465121 [Alternaria rosae]KAH6883269.1 hypothetical protein BKA58DRAFT_465121 [Alternaria rosae]